MNQQEVKNILASLFQKRSSPYDAPTEADWGNLKKRFQTDFSDEFVWFVELVAHYRFRGEILNVARQGNVSSNDSIEGTYDFEMKNGKWHKDLLPFYAIGNGDYFCVSISLGKASPVFYVYHEQGRIERYSDSFARWIQHLDTFFKAY